MTAPAPTPQGRRLLNQAAVAGMLGRPWKWFSRNRECLTRDHGFPPPIACVGLRWDSAAIERWLDGFMPAHLAPDRAPAATPAPGRDWDAELARRAQALGGPGDERAA